MVCFSTYEPTGGFRSPVALHVGNRQALIRPTNRRLYIDKCCVQHGPLCFTFSNMATPKVLTFLRFYICYIATFTQNLFLRIPFNKFYKRVRTNVIFMFSLTKTIFYYYNDDDEFDIWAWCKANNNFLMRVSLSTYQLFYTTSIHITVRLLRLALDLGLDLQYYDTLKELIISSLPKELREAKPNVPQAYLADTKVEHGAIASGIIALLGLITLGREYTISKHKAASLALNSSIEKLGRLGQSARGIDHLHTVFSTLVDNTLNYFFGIKSMKYKMLENNIIAGENLSKWAEDITELSIDPLLNDKIAISQTLRDKIIALNAKSLKFRSYFVANPPSPIILNYFNSVHKEIREMADKAAQCFTNLDDRPEPFVIYMYGPAGRGKSTTMKETLNRLGRDAGAAEPYFYNRSPNDQYWSQYVGNYAVFIDDFAQVFDTLDLTPIQEYFAMVTAAPMKLNMASLAEKGKQFTSKVIGITSNAGWPSINSIRDLEAFKRRRNILVLVNTVTDKQYDQYDAKASPSTTFTIMHPLNEGEILKDRAGTELKDLTYPEFYAYTKTLLERKEAAQKNIMDAHLNPLPTEGLRAFAYAYERPPKRTPCFLSIYKELVMNLRSIPRNALTPVDLLEVLRASCSYQLRQVTDERQTRYGTETTITWLHDDLLYNRWSWTNSPPNWERLATSILEYHTHDGIPQSGGQDVCGHDDEGVTLDPRSPLCRAQALVTRDMAHNMWMMTDTAKSREDFLAGCSTSEERDYFTVYFNLFEFERANEEGLRLLKAQREAMKINLVEPIWRHKYKILMAILGSVVLLKFIMKLVKPTMPFPKVANESGDSKTPRMKNRVFVGRNFPKSLIVRHTAVDDDSEEENLEEEYLQDLEEQVNEALKETPDIATVNAKNWAISQKIHKKAMTRMRQLGVSQRVMNHAEKLHKELGFALGQILTPKAGEKEELIKHFEKFPTDHKIFSQLSYKQLAAVRRMHANDMEERILRKQPIEDLDETYLVQAAYSLTFLDAVLPESHLKIVQSQRKRLLHHDKLPEPIGDEIRDLVHRTFLPALWRISHAKTFITALQVYGGVFLVPRHFFRALEEDDYVTFQNGFYQPKGVVIRYNSQCVQQVQDRDLVLWNVGPQVKAGRDLRSHILREKNLKKSTVSAQLLVAHRDHSYEIIDMKANMSSQPMAYGDSEEDCMAMVKHWDYRWPGMAGACGALLINVERGARCRIIGMHVAGYIKEMYGTSEPIIFEAIEDSINKNYIVNPVYQVTMPSDLNMPLKGKYQDLSFTETEEAFEKVPILPPEYFPLVSVVSPQYALQFPKKTEIRKSIIHKKVYQPVTGPSPLSVEDPRITVDPPPTSLFERTFKKYSTVTRPFPTRVHQHVMTSITSDIHRMETPHKQRKVRSVSEAINGIRVDEEGIRTWDVSKPVPTLERYEYCDAINMDSSPGWPFVKLRGADEKGKRFLFASDNLGTYTITSPLLQDSIKTRLTAAKKGERVLSVWCDQLKDERITLKKVAEGNTRTFCMAPVDYVIVMRMYFMDFCAAFYNSHVESFHAVGINVESPKWTRMYNKLRAMATRGFGGDYKNYDGVVPNTVQYELADIISEWYGDSPTSENAIVRRVLMSEAVYRASLLGNVIYYTPQGMSSGNPMTVILNSIANTYFIRCAYVLIMQEAELEDEANMYSFRRNVVSITYGDDNIQAVSKAMREVFNLHTVSDILADYGITYTGTRKLENVWEEYPDEPIQDLTFLKRGFRPHDVYPNRILSPIDKKTIQELTNWIRDSYDNDQATLENVETSFRFAYHWGKEYFEDHKEACNAALMARRLTPVETDYVNYDKGFLIQFEK